jgi:hypothetical protein
VLVDLTCDHMNTFKMQIGGSGVCRHRQHSDTVA